MNLPTTVAHRAYPNAPITEAVIEILVDRGESASIAPLESLANVWRDELPTSDKRMQSEMTMSFGEGGESTHTLRVEGLRFFDSSGLRIAQARIGGFAFARLAPYRGWDALRNDARRFWADYREVAQPLSVRRVGVRYINRIDLEQPVTDLRSFLPMVPALEPGMPAQLSGFFQQVRMELPEEGGSVTLQHARIQSPKPGHASFLLDIDVFRDQACALDEAFIWGCIEELHELERQVFEACITDKVREAIR